MKWLAREWRFERYIWSQMRLDGERVLADDQRPQCAQQYGQRFLVDGAIDAFDAALGADAQVVVRQRRRVRFAVGRIDERLRAPLRVQMQRIHLVLAG